MLELNIETQKTRNEEVTELIMHAHECLMIFFENKTGLCAFKVLLMFTCGDGKT